MTDVSKYRFPKPEMADKTRLPTVLLDADTLKQLKFCLSPGMTSFSVKALRPSLHISNVPHRNCCSGSASAA